MDARLRAKLRRMASGGRMKKAVTVAKKICGFRPKSFKDILREPNPPKLIKSLLRSEINEILPPLGLSTTGTVIECRARLENYYEEKKASKQAEPSFHDQGNVILSPVRLSADSKQTATCQVLSPVRLSAGLENQPIHDSKQTVTCQEKLNKRKKWRVTDPAKISPRFYHKDLYTANFPLVEIVTVPPGTPFPVHDKFEGVTIDPEVTLPARRKWIKSLCNATATYTAPVKESQAFPHHFSLIDSLKPYTKLSQAEMEQHSKAVGIKRKLVDNNESAEECSGFHISACVEDVQDPIGREYSSSNENMQVNLEEEAEGDGDLQHPEDVATGFADGVLHVFDQRPLKRQKTAMYSNPDRVVAIIERKFAEDKSKFNAIWQAGYYSARHAAINTQNGHGMPIYTIVLTSHFWSYAQFIPEGYIQVRDGLVDSKSMEEFLKHQELTGVSKSTLESLQHKLAIGTLFYRKNFKDNPMAQYHDGPMIVGTYYVSSDWFPLPRPVIGGAMHPDVHRLFDGLLRLIIGDSVLHITKEELQRRADNWERHSDEIADVAWFGTNKVIDR